MLQIRIITYVFLEIKYPYPVGENLMFPLKWKRPAKPWQCGHDVSLEPLTTQPGNDLVVYVTWYRAVSQAVASSEKKRQRGAQSWPARH